MFEANSLVLALALVLNYDEGQAFSDWPIANILLLTAVCITLPSIRLIHVGCVFCICHCRGTLCPLEDTPPITCDPSVPYPRTSSCPRNIRLLLFAFSLLRLPR